MLQVAEPGMVPAARIMPAIILNSRRNSEMFTLYGKHYREKKQIGTRQLKS